MNLLVKNQSQNVATVEVYSGWFTVFCGKKHQRIVLANDSRLVSRKRTFYVKVYVYVSDKFRRNVFCGIVRCDLQLCITNHFEQLQVLVEKWNLPNLDPVTFSELDHIWKSLDTLDKQLHWQNLRLPTLLPEACLTEQVKQAYLLAQYELLSFANGEPMKRLSKLGFQTPLFAAWKLHDAKQVLVNSEKREQYTVQQALNTGLLHADRWTVRWKGRSKSDCLMLTTSALSSLVVFQIAAIGVFMVGELATVTMVRFCCLVATLAGASFNSLVYMLSASSVMNGSQGSNVQQVVSFALVGSLVGFLAGLLTAFSSAVVNHLVSTNIVTSATQAFVFLSVILSMFESVLTSLVNRLLVPESLTDGWLAKDLLFAALLGASLGALLSTVLQTTVKQLQFRGNTVVFGVMMSNVTQVEHASFLDGDLSDSEEDRPLLLTTCDCDSRNFQCVTKFNQASVHFCSKVKLALRVRMVVSTSDEVHLVPPNEVLLLPLVGNTCKITFQVLTVFGWRDVKQCTGNKKQETTETFVLRLSETPRLKFCLTGIVFKERVQRIFDESNRFFVRTTTVDLDSQF